MTPRLNIGKGVSGAVRYVLGQGRDPKSGELKPDAANENESRVDWISGQNFGFRIMNADDAELARRIMEFDALNQASRTRRCEQDCVHLSLGWKPGDNPSRQQMEEAAREALAALGMANAKALFVAHRDEDHAHVHIIASKINPATGRAYDLAGSYRTLSRWSQDYELAHGGILCTRREGANELRDAIAVRDADAVLAALTKQRATFTDSQLHRALEKEIIGPARGKARAEAEKELARFHAEVIGRAQVVELVDDAKTAQAQEPWMMEPGGFDALSDEHKSSAERSYELWRTERNPEAGARHDLRDYVSYVQEKWAEANQQPDQTVRTGRRFTTRAVLDAEQQVAVAVRDLADKRSFGVRDRVREKVAAGKTMSDEQAAAFIHATLASGFAVIDGQAGTGKSYTIAAVREAYEETGRRVIGLAPTNAVAGDMRADGFQHAATIHSEIFALNNGRRQWDARTVVIVDEAAMLDTKLMAMLTSHAADAGAKLILVGDDRQLSSIDHGGMFAVLKDRHGAAELAEVKRQHKNDERRASEMFASGNFHDALNIYDGKGAIHWTRTQGEARAELIDQWTKDSAAAPEKSRFVFAYTNADVSTLNAALRDVRKQRGELGEDHQLATAYGRSSFAAGDRIQFNATEKKLGIVNGAAGTVESIEGNRVTVTLDGREKKRITFDAGEGGFDKFRHGYAGTIYKGQGRTLDQTYLYHSEHWRNASSYVAMTRHRDKAALFVARNTAKDVKQLARQMGRTDDRRAASSFEIKRDPTQQHRQEPAEAPRRLSPPELLAVLSPAVARQQAAEAAHEAELYRDDPPPAVHRGDRTAGHYDDLEASHRATEPEPPPRRYDPLREAAPPEIVRVFDAAAARATEPTAPSFDRDAANTDWQDQVDAAGIAHAATAAPKQAAEPRAAIIEDSYPSASAEAAPAPADAGAGTQAAAGTAPPEIAAGDALGVAADAAGSALEIGDRAAGKILGLFGRVAEAVTGLFVFTFMGGPKYTKQQTHDAAQARGNLETRDARDYAAKVEQGAAEHDDRIHAAKTAQQETDQRLAQFLGTLTAEANIGRDEHEPERERKRGLSR